MWKHNARIKTSIISWTPHWPKFRINAIAGNRGCRKLSIRYRRKSHPVSVMHQLFNRTHAIRQRRAVIHWYAPNTISTNLKFHLIKIYCEFCCLQDASQESPSIRHRQAPGALDTGSGRNSLDQNKAEANTNTQLYNSIKWAFPSKKNSGAWCIFEHSIDTLICLIEDKTNEYKIIMLSLHSIIRPVDSASNLQYNKNDKLIYTYDHYTHFITYTLQNTIHININIRHLLYHEKKKQSIGSISRFFIL